MNITGGLICVKKEKFNSISSEDNERDFKNETFEIMKKIILILVMSSLLPCMGEGSGMRAIYGIS